MIDISNVDVMGWRAAIHGMRNPMNSWDKSDSLIIPTLDGEVAKIGENDISLMRQLSIYGSDHAKFRRMIAVYADINAPIYWWKEFDTYKVGTVRNSCSTMHKIMAKEFTYDDFSNDCLSYSMLTIIIDELNRLRTVYLETKDKDIWRNVIQLLPESYNQRATVMLNYEVLANIYVSRRHHKLLEWREFCKWIETLPYWSDIIWVPNAG